MDAHAGGLVILLGLAIALIPPLALLSGTWTRWRVLAALPFVVVGVACVAAGLLAGA